ncbi:Protein of unknown function [Cotesia congregata]|uniref:HTH CENPB-type domain-containing protein n=1 Tax=Cotesia congregata TaxID=51543 RepID=A0A8J2HAI9_COTCN|nr:Protein of unknown function [Cotesia congregata]
MPSKIKKKTVKKIPKSSQATISKPKRTFFKYPAADLKKALEFIKSGTAIASASKQYNIPRTTLRNKLKGRAPESSGRVGPESVLGHHIEEKLEEWLLGTSKMGFPINKDFLIHSVKQLVEAEGMRKPFKNNISGRKWFEGFLKRHPRVGQKRAEHLCKVRAVVTESACGICLFDADAVDYTKCVEMKESQNDHNIFNESDSQKSSQVSSHRQFVESKIDAEVLQRFKNARAAGIDLNPSIPNDNDIIEFPFPEFSEPILDEVDEQLETLISHSPNQNSDFGVPFLLEPPIPLDIDNDSTSVRAILPSSDNAIQSSPVIIEVIKPDAVSSVSTENVSNPNTITMRRKSLDEVINEIVM